MPSTVRRSEELQKRLQRRNNFLKPADHKKDQTHVNRVDPKPDPVEKSKAALSDLRRRIDERKRLSKVVDVQQYQERREQEPVPELTGATFSESPVSQRQEPSSPVMRSAPQQNQVPVRGNSLKNYYKDHDRYRKNVSEQNMQLSDEKAPPSQIEVRSTIDAPENKEDDDTEVSEITTDVRIMSTKGANFAERRMAGNVQKKLARPSLSTPTGRQLERDVNINVNNLRHLGKAVELAKMDLQKEMSPVNDTTRHGLPYESTDYRPSIDEDEADSWGDAIRTGNRENQEKKRQYIADKSAAKKLQNLVKEAYSYEGDVFIDATEIREEDLDGNENVESYRDNEEPPINVDDDTVGSSELLANEKKFLSEVTTSGRNEEKDELPEQSREDTLEMELPEDDLPDMSEMDRENVDSDDHPTEDARQEPSNFASNPAAMASEFYNSSLGFFKSFSNQVDTQLKTFQEKGLISKNDVDGMLGILKRDVKETERNLPKDTDDAVIFLGDSFEASVCGSNLEAVEEGMKGNTGSSSDAVEKWLESLKNSYNLGISKCGIDSDLIKENTKAIEQMVANLKQANGGSSDNDQNDPSPEDNIDGEVLKALSKEDSPNDPVPLTGAKGGNKMFMLSFSMPGSE